MGERETAVMRCEECGRLGEPISSDPDDPWPLCPEHIAELERDLAEAGASETVDLETVRQVLDARRR